MLRGKAAFPVDYFADRAKKCLDLAKRVRNRALAQTFIARSKALTQTAMKLGRAMARQNGIEKRDPHVVFSQAKTLTELRRDLQNLSGEMSVYLMMRDYIDLFSRPDDAWKSSTQLAEEYGCQAELRPDGCIWFVKRNDNRRSN